MKLIAYGKTNWGRDFPSTLEDPTEAKNYVSAFDYALSPLLKEVSDGDEHIMRACSFLVILPPLPGMPARHLDIPMDLNSTYSKNRDHLNIVTLPFHSGEKHINSTG